MVSPLRSPRVAAGLLLAAFAVVGYAGRGPATAVVAVPAPVAQVGAWAGRVLPLDATDAVLMGRDNDIAMMEYRTGQEPPVWWLRVASVGDRSAFHPPELCYVGNDIEVLERGPVIVLSGGQGHKVMRLLVAQNGRAYEAWYWFTAGERVTSSYYQQQLWLLRDTLHGTASSGTLVRISTPLDGGASASRRRLLAFFTAYQDRLHIPQVRLARR